MKGGMITTQMKAQVNGWEDLSTSLLKVDMLPLGLFTPFKGMDVSTVEEGATTVGILLFVEAQEG